MMAQMMAQMRELKRKYGILVNLRASRTGEVKPLRTGHCQSYVMVKDLDGAQLPHMVTGPTPTVGFEFIRNQDSEAISSRITCIRTAHRNETMIQYHTPKILIKYPVCVLK
jgi:hypothetical protein